jgi:inner membrane protein involved in colicin E2 resistance
MTGFHLSASVVSPSQQTAQGKSNTFNVAVTFDRRRITSCNCTCASRAFWCAHVVAVCLYRIHQVFFQHKENVRSMKLIFRFLSLIWWPFVLLSASPWVGCSATNCKSSLSILLANYLNKFYQPRRDSLMNFYQLNRLPSIRYVLLSLSFWGGLY